MPEDILPLAPFPAGPPHERAPQTGTGFRPAGGGGPETVPLAGQHPRAEERSPQRPAADRRRLDHRDLPESGPDVKSRKRYPSLTEEEKERLLLLQTLEQTGNNRSKTAKLLNMSRTTLYEKLRKYGIIC